MPDRTSDKKCNVILSAGGIRALSQIGALEALEEQGWTIQKICGISAGSIVSSFYAYGTPIDRMRNLAIHQDFCQLKRLNLRQLNTGIYRFHGLGKWVRDNSIDKGYIKRCNLNIVACSLSSGNKKVFVDPIGDQLVQAIEATCCIPVIFKPISIEAEVYADGALWSSAPLHFFEDDPLPTFVINVQDSHTKFFTSFTKPFTTLYRIFEVFQINRLKSLKKRTLNKPIYIIEPEIGSISPLAFKLDPYQRLCIIEEGKKSMLKFLESFDA